MGKKNLSLSHHRCSFFFLASSLCRFAKQQKKRRKSNHGPRAHPRRRLRHSPQAPDADGAQAYRRVRQHADDHPPDPGTEEDAGDEKGKGRNCEKNNRGGGERKRGAIEASFVFLFSSFRAFRTPFRFFIFPFARLESRCRDFFFRKSEKGYRRNDA